MVRIAAAIALLALAACHDTGSSGAGHVPSYRQPFVNGSSNSTYEPPNSLPR